MEGVVESPTYNTIFSTSDISCVLKVCVQYAPTVVQLPYCVNLLLTCCSGPVASWRAVGSVCDWYSLFHCCKKGCSTHTECVVQYSMTRYPFTPHSTTSPPYCILPLSSYSQSSGLSVPVCEAHNHILSRVLLGFESVFSVMATSSVLKVLFM